MRCRAFGLGVQGCKGLKICGSVRTTTSRLQALQTLETKEKIVNTRGQEKNNKERVAAGGSVLVFGCLVCFLIAFCLF